MCVLVCAIKMMTTIIVHRSITVAVLLLVIFGNIVISQRSVVQQQQQQVVLSSTAAAIKIKNSTTTTTSTTITSNSTSSSTSSSTASGLASIKNLTPPSALKTTTNKGTTNKTTTNKATTTTTTRDKLINKNKNETTSSEISIEVESVADADDDVDIDGAATAAGDAVSRVVVVGGAAAAAASHPANSTQILSTFEDVGPSSITPTTYRPLRPSVAPQTSAQDRERKLMNVLAARRTALHRGGYRTRIGTTGRTASASIETTPKTPTDPRSICIRNCTKNFTRRTTASCMRQCASFQRSAATANGTAIVVKASSKSGLGTQQRERDTNEILFTDESSHGLFVVAKELNGTANHISEGVGMKSSGGYKFKTRKKPPASLVVVTVAPPTSFEEDDIAPYLFFGQKLPPIRPAMLSITAVNNEHPKLLEVSVASSTPESVSSTLSAVERSRSRYKYNMRDRVNLPFNRRFSAAGQAEQRRNAMSSMGSEPPTPSKSGGATTMTTPTTTRTMSATAMMEESKHESLEIQNASFVRRAGDAVEAPQPSKVVPNLAAAELVPSTSTPLIITVLSDEEEGATEVPRVDKSEVLKTKTATAASTTITTTKKSLKMATALTPSRPPEGTSTARTTTTSTSKPTARSTTMRTKTTTTTTTTTRVPPPPPLPTLSPPSPAPSQTKSSSFLPTSHVPFLSPSPSSLATSPASSLAPSPPSPTTTRTTPFTSSSPMTSPALPKSIIEEDTERLRALGPSLTQEINTDDKTNLVIFVNRTSGPYVPHGDNQNNNSTDDDDDGDDGFPNLQPTRSPSRFRPHTEPLPTILHTTVLTSIRSTVHPRTTPRTPAASPAAGAIPLAPTSVSTSGVGSDISSTEMTDEREVTVEIRRINMATYVLVGIGVLPLLAVIAFVMRNFIIRRSIKTDEVFDVCITDQQPISPVKKLSSKYRHEDEDDEDDVDHHHHHQQLQKQQQQTQQHHHHQHQHHRPIYRQHSMHQQKQSQQRDTNYNINIHCNNSINSNSGRYDEQCSVTSDQEFDRNNIRLKSLLGEGNFGHVWKAEADDLSGHFGATRIVAVKTVRAGSTQVGLKEEASIMRKLGSHQNVVTLLGACVESEPHMIIMEYAMRGRLLSLLRAARNATNILPASVPGGRSLTPLSPRTLSGFALDIACGMEYIAQRRIVHRDLAARNVLLDHNGICKICDFGMSLDLDAERQAKTLQKKQNQKEEEANEIMRSNSNKFKFDFSGRFIINHWSPNFGANSNNSNTKTNNSQQQLKECSEKKSPRHTNHDTISRRPALPIRWMAPEALQYHVFTTETDIWAFGIVLWEIATLGSTPYSHFTGREVIRRVPGGLRPDIPKEGRHEFYNLMSRCWHKEPQLRPSFTQARLEITRSLGKWVEDDSATSDYMDVSGFSEDMEHGMVYFNHRISEFECEI